MKASNRLGARPCGLPEQGRSMIASSTIDSRIAARDSLRRDLDAALERAHKADELEGRLREARRQLDEARRLHRQSEQARLFDQRQLESLLDALAPDWQNEYQCPDCEDSIRLPDHDVCAVCEARAEGDAEQIAMDRWEDRS